MNQKSQKSWLQLGFIFLSKWSIQSKQSNQSKWKNAKKIKGIADVVDFSTIPEMPLFVFEARRSIQLSYRRPPYTNMLRHPCFTVHPLVPFVIASPPEAGVAISICMINEL